jgi:Protein of unknown function (DUF3295)
MDTSAQLQADQVPLQPPEPGCSPDQALIPFRPSGSSRGLVSQHANRDKRGITSNNEGSKLGSGIEDDNSSYGKTSPKKAGTVILSTASPSGNEVASLHSRQHPKDENAIESGGEEERLTSKLTLGLENQRSRTSPLNGPCPVEQQRTTRRSMLEKELPAKLRREMLWERRQSHTTANAIKKRKHIAVDPLQLQNYPYLEEFHSQDYHWRGW